MAKSYLVTGGTGFIGSAIVRRLLQGGNAVRVFDNNFRGRARRLQGVADDLEMVAGDIRDADAVSLAVKGVDTVVHLAYINGTEFFYSEPELVLEVAVKGMVNVLDACRRHGVGDLIYASSSEVYQTPPAVPTDESAPLVVPDPLNPRYSYGGGKIIGELMAINYGRTGFDRVTIFRPHNIYGPDMGWEHVIPQFTLRLKELCAGQPRGTLPFPIQGSGGETRAFCHIDDFVEGFRLVDEKGGHLEIYHIGAMEETPIADLARLTAAAFGRQIDIVAGPLREGSTLRRCPDVGKLRALGYTQKVTIAQGIGPTVAWYRENADLKQDGDRGREVPA